MSDQQEQTKPNLNTLEESEDLRGMTVDGPTDSSVMQDQVSLGGQTDMELSEEERLLEDAGTGTSGPKETDLHPKTDKGPYLSKKEFKEKKLAEGTWVSAAEWRKARGVSKKQRRKNVKHSGPGGHIEQPGTSTSSEHANKRNLSSSSESTGRTPVSKRSRNEGGRMRSVVTVSAAASAPSTDTTATTSANLSEEDVSGVANPSAAQVLSAIKMVLVPENYPDDRLSEEDVLKLRGKLADEICEAEDPALLRICRSYHERGACVLVCENEETRAWVKLTAPKLQGESDEKRVIAGDYKDIIRITRVLLRPPAPLAEREVKQILQRVAIQNKGISTEEWKVVNDNKGKDFRTITLIIDDISARILKERDWKVYLGPDQVRFKVLSSGPGKKTAELPGNEGKGPSM